MLWIMNELKQSIPGRKSFIASKLKAIKCLPLHGSLVVDKCKIMTEAIYQRLRSFIFLLRSQEPLQDSQQLLSDRFRVDT